jgi:hypothetical protein
VPFVQATDVTDASEDASLQAWAMINGCDHPRGGLTGPNTDGTGLYLHVNGAGVTSLQRVTLGAVDSGGIGFRVLRIPNS